MQWIGLSLIWVNSEISIVTKTYPPGVNRVAMTLSDITRELGKNGNQGESSAPQTGNRLRYSLITLISSERTC
jgi:hypothetical protein